MNNKESNKEKLQQFIKEQGYDPNYWFIEFVNQPSEQLRIRDILDKKEYLAGDHAINKRLPEAFAGKMIEPRKVVLQYARRLIEYATSFIIGNGFTYSGDQELVKEINKLNKKVFNSIDYDIVKNVYSYGNSWEILYNSAKDIKSSIIDAADAYPVITNTEGEYIAFVQSYEVNNISYWNVFIDNEVIKYNNVGGAVKYVGTSKNIGGLPINYRNSNPLDEVFGRSDLDDYISVLNNQEDLLSKALDGFYRYITGIPVVRGQMMTNYDLPKHIVGGGVILDSDADFFFAHNQFDHKAFETLYGHLMTSLLDVSGTPASAMGKQDISNLSEVSLRLLYVQASEKARITERYIKEGLYERLERIRRLLESQGKHFTDEQFDSLSINFQYAVPSSETDIISNLKSLREINAISLESLLKHNPYVSDVASELELIQNEHANNTVTMSKQTT